MEVESDIDTFSAVDGPEKLGFESMLGQGQKLGFLLVEDIEHSLRLELRVRSIENGISPPESFFVEVLEVSEGTSFEEALTNKADGSFDALFFVRAARGTGLRLKVVVSRELEQLCVETNSVGQPFDYGRLEIVVQQDSRTSSQFVQRANMTAPSESRPQGVGCFLCFA